MREIHKLSAVKVARLQRPGKFSDEVGLWLQISPTDVKS